MNSETHPSAERYSLGMRVFHWSMSALLLGLIAVGWYMTGLSDTDAQKFTLIFYHASVGVLLFILAFFRVRLKFRTPHPELPAHLQGHEKTLVHTIHFCLYLLLFLVPLIGIGMTLLGGYGLPFFFFEIPNFIPKSLGIPVGWVQFLGSSHQFLAYTLLFLIGMHVAGVGKEWAIHKINVLKRML